MSKPDKHVRKYHATAKVTVVVEVKVVAGWGGDCSVGQVHKQAAAAAIDKVRELAKEGIRIVGEPSVTAIFVKDADE